MDIRFRFESDQSRYVAVLADSTIATDNLVSQNAGSSSPGMYFTELLEVA